MPLFPINFNFPKKVPFLPDRGTEQDFNGVAIIAEFGRLMVIRKSNGRIALKVGDGVNTPANTNYIGEASVEGDLFPTLTVGGFTPGINANGFDLDTFARQLLTPYIPVNISSISVAPNLFEVGQLFNASLTLSFLPAFPTNFVQITYNSLPSNVLNGPIVSIIQNTVVPVNVVYNIPTVVSIIGTALGTNGEQVTRNTSLAWQQRTYFGSSPNAILANITELKALSGSILTSSRQRDYTFTSGYSFICIPSAVSVVGISFIDVDILSNNELLPADWTQMNDIIGNNDYGISMTYKVFRSTYAYGGATKTRVK